MTLKLRKQNSRLLALVLPFALLAGTAGCASSQKKNEPQRNEQAGEVRREEARKHRASHDQSQNQSQDPLAQEREALKRREEALDWREQELRQLEQAGQVGSPSASRAPRPGEAVVPGTSSCACSCQAQPPEEPNASRPSGAQSGIAGDEGSSSSSGSGDFSSLPDSE